MNKRTFGLFFFFMATALIAGAFGYFLAVRQRNQMAVVVNGEAISRRDLDVTLSLFRDQAIRLLATERIVAQQARRMGLTTKDTLQKSGDWDDELFQAKLNQARTDSLFRQIVLSDASPAYKRKIYDTFKPQLQKYVLKVVRLGAFDVQRFQDDLKSGADFTALEKKYGLPSKDLPVNAQPRSLAELRPFLGHAGTLELLRLKPGEMTRPIGTAAGVVLVRLESIQDSYQQLEPSIENLIFDAKKRYFTYVLGVDSVVNSQLATGLGGQPSNTKPSSSPESEQTGLPRPSGTPAVINSMPSLDPNRKTLPSDVHSRLPKAGQTPNEVNSLPGLNSGGKPIPSSLPKPGSTPTSSPGP